jgi:hypothetical protein
VATRYSSTAKPELGEAAGAAAERRRWRDGVGEAEGEARRARMQCWRRSMAAAAAAARV